MFCNQCGASCPDGSAFCPDCGHQLSGAEVPAPTPSAPKKKSLAWLYVLIFALVVAVATIVLIIAFGGDGNKDDDKQDAPTSTTATESTTPTSTSTTVPATTRPSSIKLNDKYDLGYFDGEYYINEWADLKLKIPTYWDDEGSGTIENESTAVALYRYDEESRGLVQVMLVDRQGVNIGPDYMINYMVNHLSSTDDVTFENPSDNVKVANHTGTGVIGWLSDGDETYCVGMFCYEVDDCLVFVNVIGYDRNAMSDMMLDFTGV